jgi:hypothetical protein
MSGYTVEIFNHILLSLFRSMVWVVVSTPCHFLKFNFQLNLKLDNSRFSLSLAVMHMVSEVFNTKDAQVGNAYFCGYEKYLNPTVTSMNCYRDLSQ